MNIRWSSIWRYRSILNLPHDLDVSGWLDLCGGLVFDLLQVYCRLIFELSCRAFTGSEPHMVAMEIELESMEVKSED